MILQNWIHTNTHLHISFVHEWLKSSGSIIMSIYVLTYFSVWYVQIHASFAKNAGFSVDNPSIQSFTRSKRFWWISHQRGRWKISPFPRGKIQYEKYVPIQTRTFNIKVTESQKVLIFSFFPLTKKSKKKKNARNRLSNQIRHF